MGKVYISSGGGGTDLDVVTAAAGDILAGKVIVGPDGEPLTGTLPNRGQAQNAGGWGSGGSGSDAYFAMNRIPEGAYFSNGADWAPEVRMKQTDVRSAIGATNAANWRSNTTIAGLKGTMPEQGGKTVTPKSSNQTAVSANRYVTGNIIVAGDSNLKAANIKKGVPIFGIIGTFEGYVPGAADLYKNGNNVKGIVKTNSNSRVYFDTDKIRIDTTTGYLASSSAINTTGYSKINLDVQVSHSQGTYDYWINLAMSTTPQTSATSLNSVTNSLFKLSNTNFYNDGAQGRKTISYSLNNVAQNGYFWFAVSRANALYDYNILIYRIWLS